MADVARTVQLYDLSHKHVISEMPYYSDIQFMDGDEMEIQTVGAFKIVGRRWSLSGESIILVLLLEPLA